MSPVDTQALAHQEASDFDLPEGWCLVALKDLCESFEYGTSSKSQPSGTVAVLRMGNIQNGEIDWTDLVFTSNPDEIRRYALRPNTVLFNRTNSPELVGKSAIYRGDRPAVFAGYLIRINNLPQLNPEYLNLLLSSQYAREFCAIVKTDGVSQSNINARKLGTLEVPFCCYPEQTRIVTRLRDVFGELELTKRSLKRAAAILKRFRQSVLAAACSGRLTEDWRDNNPISSSATEILQDIKKALSTQTHKRSRRQMQGEEVADPAEPLHTAAELPESWLWTRFGQLYQITYGLSEPLRKMTPDHADDLPVISMANITANGTLNLDGLRYFPIPASKRAALLLRCGDVLFNWRNAPKHIGKTTVFKSDGDFINASFLLRMRPPIPEKDGGFCALYLNFLRQTGYFLRASRAAVNQSNFNASEVGRMAVPLPPLEEQHEIVRRVESLFKLADSIEKRVAAAQARADKLTQSILAKAFRGELVRTEAELARQEGREYEPASVLLERIRAEREHNGHSTKRIGSKAKVTK